jgi:hypothetical protein
MLAPTAVRLRPLVSEQKTLAPAAAAVGCCTCRRRRWLLHLGGHVRWPLAPEPPARMRTKTAHQNGGAGRRACAAPAATTG